MLRWALEQGDSVDAVLGNHDLHLLAQREGLLASRPRDTLDAVLSAPDAAELCDWLAMRPFAAREGDYLLAHAGIHPAWSVAEAERRAADATAALRRDPRLFLEALYALRGDGAGFRESGDRSAAPPGAVADASVLTRIRAVDRTGEPDYGFSGPPEDLPPGRRPWFERARIPRGTTVLFGHWAALGLTASPAGPGRVLGLDSGCVWGGFLTALRLEDEALAVERATPEQSLRP